jgi:hypothetical protein
MAMREPATARFAASTLAPSNRTLPSLAIEPCAMRAPDDTRLIA